MTTSFTFLLPLSIECPISFRLDGNFNSVSFVQLANAKLEMYVKLSGKNTKDKFLQPLNALELIDSMPSDILTVLIVVLFLKAFSPIATTS